MWQVDKRVHCAHNLHKIFNIGSDLLPPDIYGKNKHYFCIKLNKHNMWYSIDSLVYWGKMSKTLDPNVFTKKLVNLDPPNPQGFLWEGVYFWKIFIEKGPFLLNKIGSVCESSPSASLNLEWQTRSCLRAVSNHGGKVVGRHISVYIPPW